MKADPAEVRQDVKREARAVSSDYTLSLISNCPGNIIEAINEC